jgi:hypothetical protein
VKCKGYGEEGMGVSARGMVKRAWV